MASISIKIVYLPVCRAFGRHYVVLTCTVYDGKDTLTVPEAIDLVSKFSTIAVGTVGPSIPSPIALYQENPRDISTDREPSQSGWEHTRAGPSCAPALIGWAPCLCWYPSDSQYTGQLSNRTKMAISRIPLFIIYKKLYYIRSKLYSSPDWFSHVGLKIKTQILEIWVFSFSQVFWKRPWCHFSNFIGSSTFYFSNLLETL